MHPTISVEKTGPGFKRVGEAMRLLSGERVLVGIPESKNARKKGKNDRQPINNAALLFILSKGSQKRNIPATPIVEPAIAAEGNRERITGFLKQAAQAELEGDHAGALEYLQKAGMAGTNAAKRWFTDPRNGWPPNAESTMKRKLAKLSPAKRIAALQRIADQGGDPTGVITRNIMTGQVRRALTYVVEQDGEPLDTQDVENEDSEAEGDPSPTGSSEASEGIGAEATEAAEVVL